ncbi:MAG: hypothetical protein JWQ71_3447, partial [Pedosphaera sp.]|nr:hypothetical protein [Pedosphaera sp.]
MNKESGARSNFWQAQDLLRLSRALKAASDTRLYERLLALRMVAS